MPIIASTVYPVSRLQLVGEETDSSVKSTVMSLWPGLELARWRMTPAGTEAFPVAVGVALTTAVSNPGDTQTLWTDGSALYFGATIINSGGGGDITGSIAATQVAYGTAPNTVGGDAGFIYSVAAHQIALLSSSAVLPAYSFVGDTNTGVFNISADVLGISTGGVMRLGISTTAMVSTLIGIFPASTTSVASIRLTHGVAPSAPVDGDLWTTTAGLFARISGSTVGPYSAGDGTGTVTSVVAGTGLNVGAGPGGTITTTGTLNLANTAVTPGAYTLASVTVDQQGRLTVVTSGTVDLTAQVTGVLPVANGGTGQATASAAFGALSPLTTKGDLLGFSTVNDRVAVGTNGQVLTADSTQAFGLKWATVTAGSVTSVVAGTGLNVGAGPGGTITTTGTLNLADTAVTPGTYHLTDIVVDQQGRITSASTGVVDVTNDVMGNLPIANGGTGEITATAAFGALSPLTTKGDLLGFSTVNDRVAVGTNGQVLTADSAQAFGLKWATPSIPDGSAAAPGLALTSDASTGLFNSGGFLGFSTGGTLRLTIRSTDILNTLPFKSADGSVGAPSLTFTSASTHGIYFTGSATAISAGGVEAVRFGINGGAVFGGAINATAVAVAGAAVAALGITAGAHTAMPASTEYSSISLTAATQEFATGALATQRFAVITAPTYGFVGASTITNAATLAITGGPVAGANAVITNSWALWLQNTSRLRVDGTSLFNDNVVVANGSKVDADNIVIGDGSTYIGKFTYSSSNLQLGSYSNVGLQFDTNGAVRMELDVNGNVAVGTGALLTTSTDGFFYIPTTAGTPTGVPTTKTGLAPLVINSTGNKLYYYNSGWQDVTGITGTAASTEIAIGSGATTLTHNSAFTISGTALQAVSTSADATVQIDAINSAASGTSTLASVFAGNSATMRANLFSYGPASTATVAGTSAANSVALGATGGPVNVFYGSLDGLGTPTVRFVSVGAEVFHYTTASIVSTVPFLGSAGSNSAPSISLSGDPNTGLYSVGADDLGFTVGGSLRLDISTTTATFTTAVLISGILAGFLADIVIDGTTTVTLSASHQGRVLRCTSGSAVAVDMPGTLPIGFSCTITQDGDGTVTVSGSAGGTVHNRQSLFATAGKYAVASLVVLANAGGSSAIGTLAGDLA